MCIAGPATGGNATDAAGDSPASDVETTAATDVASRERRGTGRAFAELGAHGTHRVASTPGPPAPATAPASADAVGGFRARAPRPAAAFTATVSVGTRPVVADHDPPSIISLRVEKTSSAASPRIAAATDTGPRALKGAPGACEGRPSRRCFASRRGPCSGLLGPS